MIKLLQTWYISMLNNSKKSFIINYKYIIIIALGFLFYSIKNNISYIVILINYIICLNSSYFWHMWAHKLYSYPLTYGHVYHHINHNNIFVMFIETLIDINFLLALLFFKYIIKLEYVIDLWFLDEFFIIWFALCYYTIHHINYGLLKVNNIHVKHHKNMQTNLAHEFMDIFYGTKQDDEFENIGHNIPNMIIIYSLLIFLKKYFENISPWIFIYFYMSILVISLFINVILCSKDLNEYLNNDLDSFCDKDIIE